MEINLDIDTHKHMQRQTYSYTHTHTTVNIRMYILMRIQIHTHTYTYLYTYINEHNRAVCQLLVFFGRARLVVALLSPFNVSCHGHVVCFFFLSRASRRSRHCDSVAAVVEQN